MLKLMTRCLLATVFAAMAASASAQPAQTGTVQGEVKDSSGAILPGVMLTLTSEDRGFSRSAVSDENGRYIFPAVPIGRYTLAAALQGFKTEQATGNVVETDKATTVPFTLAIGSLTDTVVVTGNVPIVTPSNVTATTRMRSEEFQNIPVGRSYQGLIATAPGLVGRPATRTRLAR